MKHFLMPFVFLFFFSGYAYASLSFDCDVLDSVTDVQKKKLKLSEGNVGLRGILYFSKDGEFSESFGRLVSSKKEVEGYIQILTRKNPGVLWITVSKGDSNNKVISESQLHFDKLAPGTVQYTRFDRYLIRCEATL